MRHRHRIGNDSILKLGLIWLALLSLGRTPGIAAETCTNSNSVGWMMDVTEEDDFFAYPWAAHTDRYYTQGVKGSYMREFQATTNAPYWLAKIFGWKDHDDTEAVGGVLGQNMYTPENLSISTYIPSDRPYAGWLYVGPVYQRNSQIASHLFVQDSFEADVGMIGPDSLAGDVQRFWHGNFFPGDVPQGWRNQVRNEPGIVLKYERSLRYSPTDWTARYIDVIPRAGGDLGNVFTFATGGVAARCGLNLPSDFGEVTIDSSGSVNTAPIPDCSRFSCYAFGSFDGRAVGQNITIDGSWFQSDPHNSKYTWVADMSYGLAMAMRFRSKSQPQIELSYTHIDRTKEFHGQNGDDIFGSVNVKFSCGVP